MGSAWLLGDTLHPAKGPSLPYIYVDRVLNELRDELLSAMHAAVQRELRQGRIDVPALYRSFTRAAAKQCANPALVSDKCVEQHTTRPKKGRTVRPESTGNEE